MKAYMLTVTLLSINIFKCYSVKLNMRYVYKHKLMYYVAFVPVHVACAEEHP